MDDLASPVGEQEENELQPLTDRQNRVHQLLDGKKEETIGEESPFDDEQLETKAKISEKNIDDNLVCLQKASKLPTLNEADVVSLREKKQLSAITLSNSETKTEEEEEEEEEEEDDDKKFVKPLSDLPETFSLLAKINVPYDITAQEILSMSGKRIQKSADFEPLFDEEARAPSPPLPPKVDDEEVRDRKKLVRAAPIYIVESEADASSVEFKTFCENAPIALIRGLTSVKNMQISVFSSDVIKKVKKIPTIDMRSQREMPEEKNYDFMGNPSWSLFSVKGSSTIQKFAKYQKQSMKEAEISRQHNPEGHGGKRRRVENTEETAVTEEFIQFGTNIDISDSDKWEAQLKEISKLPSFCQVVADENMLSYLDYDILGMNTVQLYMKVSGSRTPAHQENNSFASININIGPGDCEWFGCPNEYWGVFEKLCKKNHIDYLNYACWPNLEELLEENVPVYRFTQKRGDLVWVGLGFVHWVQAKSVCNNVAWNVGPLTFNQLSMSIHSHELNKVRKYKSLVPMQHLAWQLAKNVQFTNQSVYNLIRGLLIRSLSFCKIVVDYATANGKQLKPQLREKGEVANYCTTCQIEVFNILFVKQTKKSSSSIKRNIEVYCVYCSQKKGINKYIVLQQFTMSELTQIFDGMVLHQAPNIALTA